jgi:hypothetical protein
MTSTTTSTMSTSTSTCGATVYQLPVTDAACGAKLSGNMSTVFDTCCKGDSPVKYDDDCGIYCLAQEQTVQELSDCIMSKANNYRDVFCEGKQNATATAAATTTKSTSTSTSTSSGTSTRTHNAAANNGPVSMGGVGVLVLLFCSAVMGLFA